MKGQVWSGLTHWSWIVKDIQIMYCSQTKFENLKSKLTIWKIKVNLFRKWKLNLDFFSSDYDAKSNCDVKQTISNHCHYVFLLFRQIVTLHSYHVVKCHRNQFRANMPHAQVSQCSFKVLHFMVHMCVCSESWTWPKYNCGNWRNCLPNVQHF